MVARSPLLLLAAAASLCSAVALKSRKTEDLPFQLGDESQPEREAQYRNNQKDSAIDRQMREEADKVAGKAWFTQMAADAAGIFGIDPATKAVETAENMYAHHIEKGGSDNCAIQSYPAEFAFPSVAEKGGFRIPVEIGTPDNIQALDKTPFDLTGVWWLKGDTMHNQLFSFAGATVNASTFPVKIDVPMSNAHMWTWDDSIVGRFGMLAASFVSGGKAAMSFYFSNSKNGWAETWFSTFPALAANRLELSYAGENLWTRPNQFVQENNFWHLLSLHSQGKSLQSSQEEPQAEQAEVVRIIDMNGIPLMPYWEEYLESMANKRLLTFNTDTWCRRVCFSMLSLFSVSDRLQPCSTCNSLCGTQNDKSEFHAPTTLL